MSGKMAPCPEARVRSPPWLTEEEMVVRTTGRTVDQEGTEGMVSAMVKVYTPVPAFWDTAVYP